MKNPLNIFLTFCVLFLTLASISANAADKYANYHRTGLTKAQFATMEAEYSTEEAFMADALAVCKNSCFSSTCLAQICGLTSEHMGSMGPNYANACFMAATGEAHKLVWESNEPFSQKCRAMASAKTPSFIEGIFPSLR